MMLFEQILSMHDHFTPRLGWVRLSNQILSRGSCSLTSCLLSPRVFASRARRFQTTHSCNILALLVVVILVMMVMVMMMMTI